MLTTLPSYGRMIKKCLYGWIILVPPGHLDGHKGMVKQGIAFIGTHGNLFFSLTLLTSTC